MFSIRVILIYISTNNIQVFPFLYFIFNICYFLSFSYRQSNRFEVMNHCGEALEFQ
jgi:hypothetical protein